MKLQKTLFVLGLLVLLNAFLGFPSHVDTFIYIVLGLLVIIVSVLNIPDRVNNKESVFSENVPEPKDMGPNDDSSIVEPEPDLEEESEEVNNEGGTNNAKEKEE